MPRADQRKNADKVTAEFVKDPLQTVREVAKKVGISKSAVADHKNNLDKVGLKDIRIVSLIDKDLEIVELAQDLIREKLLDKETTDKMNVRDISTVAKDSSTRYSLFKGDATDSEGGLKAGVVLLPPLDENS